MQIQEAVIHLLLKQPFYGHVASMLTYQANGIVEHMKTITTPNPHVLYNRDWYEELDKNKAIGILIHELLHLILLHQFRRGSRDLNLWAVACDMAVNEHIHSDLLPDTAVTRIRIQQDIKQSLLPMKSAEYYYEALNKPDDSIHFIQRNEKVGLLLSSGEELFADQIENNQSSELDQKTVTKMVSDMVTEASEDGETPQGLTEFIKENFNAYRVNWRNVLKRFLSGKGRAISQKSYKKVSKRYEDMPGNKRTIGLNVLLALDESGSIGSDQLEYFFAEVLKIKRISGTSITVTQFDTQCSDPVPIERYARGMKRLKSGGTDFQPIFKLAERLKLPFVVIFTDGDGKMPVEVSQKVLWVLTKEPKAPMPFGHQIVFEK